MSKTTSRKTDTTHMLPNYRSALEHYRVAMGPTMIPIEGQTSKYISEDDLTARKAEESRMADLFERGLVVEPGCEAAGIVRSHYRSSFLREELTPSQRRIAQGESLCMCPVMSHCGLMATLHVPPCEFCHGSVVPGHHTLFRYYPSDFGWWTLRHQVKRCRELAGLPDYPEVISYTTCEHPTEAHEMTQEIKSINPKLINKVTIDGHFDR